MGSKNPENPDNAMRRRTLYEAFAWVVLIAFLWTVDTFGKISYRSNTGIGKDNFRLIVDQASSAIAVLIMIIFVINWLRLFPVRKNLWVSAVIGHTVGSIFFALGHHILMIVQRVAFFALNDMTYHWQPRFVSNLIVEYQKDIKIYIGIVAVVSAYQYFRRAQSHRPARAELTGRLVVQTGLGEAILAYEQIDYIEASRNYVEIHAGDKDYLIRDTFANIEKRLAGGYFVRCHRSYMVNLNKVAEIRMIDGAQRIHLKSGATLPLGRSYREDFKASIAADN